LDLHLLSQKVAQSVRNHSFSQAQYQNNLAEYALQPSFHWNRRGLIIFIRPFYFVQYGLPESRPGYNEKWSH